MKENTVQLHRGMVCGFSFYIATHFNSVDGDISFKGVCFVRLSIRYFYEIH